MHAISNRFFLTVSVACLLLAARPLRAQSDASKSHCTVEGTVLDVSNHRLAGASLILESAGLPRSLPTTADAQGRFRFDALTPSTYVLRAKLEGFREGKEGPFSCGAGEARAITVRLEKDSAAAFEFSDEPQFTVAGVTDTSNLGGHGSDRVVRNSDALSKDTASLANAGMHDTGLAADEAEAELCAELAGKETAEGRFRLAELEERRGESLAAARDYQRAAEMQPSEPHLFSWGAELLLHRAVEPAAEVFANGMRRYPNSVRMRLGLSAAMYAEGLREDAARIILEASDLDPADPSPYLFLGRLQTTEPVVPSSWAERLKRFAELHPEDGTAHCLYATALAKQAGETRNLDEVDRQLTRAIDLDPKLGSAYLQLGILRAGRKDYVGAITALQKAVANTAYPDEAHYRLAEVYRRLGEMAEANRETELFKAVTAEKNKQADRERHELQQFVYTLRGQSATRPAPPDSH